MFNLLQTQIANNESVIVQNGKIYVVLIVVCMILIGLFLYVASLDYKVHLMEKK